MVTNEDRKIIEAEISRLDARYRDAQDRYAYSGSASTDRTMYKYQVLSHALANYLTGNADASKERLLITQQDQLYRLKEAIAAAYRSRGLDGDTYIKLTDILRG